MAVDATASIVVACCSVLDVCVYDGTAVCGDVGVAVVLWVACFTAAGCVVAVVTANILSERSV